MTASELAAPAAGHAARLRSILSADPERWRVLGLVASLRLPDCWVGAGTIRDAVWDHGHGRPPAPPSGEVDVVRFDAARVAPSADRALEDALRALDPGVAWSVRNQARMHVRNGDPPYASTTEAMRRWPETATAVAARRTGIGEAGDGGFAVAAPFGLDDLFGLVLRPTFGATDERRAVHEARVRDKAWLRKWPLLRPAADGAPPPSPEGGRGPSAPRHDGFRGRGRVGVLQFRGKAFAQRASRRDLPVVKRRKEEEVVGVLEFEKRTSADPEFVEWLADHRARNGGKVRVSQGGSGVRVMFSKEADMAFWKERSEQSAKAK